MLVVKGITWQFARHFSEPPQSRFADSDPGLAPQQSSCNTGCAAAGSVTDAALFQQDDPPELFQGQVIGGTQADHSAADDDCCVQVFARQSDLFFPNAKVVLGCFRINISARKARVIAGGFDAIDDLPANL